MTNTRPEDRVSSMKSAFILALMTLVDFGFDFRTHAGWNNYVLSLEQQIMLYTMSSQC